MFTGIIETLGTIKSITKEGSNVHYIISSPISSELKIDQSVAHNGVCLTVVECDNTSHRVTAIDETLRKSNLHTLKVGDLVNLERCLKIGDRLDGHMVQGHVDLTAKCTSIKSLDGSSVFEFTLSQSHSGLIVSKGSITVNGVSLTVVECDMKSFSVAIIPYTLEHTHFRQTALGDFANIEYDILGKYVQAQLSRYQ